MSNVGFDTRHCWCIRGFLPDGRKALMRWIPGSHGFKTIDQCRWQAIRDVCAINSDGGKVLAVKQHLDINELWQDC